MSNQVGLVPEMALLRGLWRNKSAKQSQVNIKLGILVDPIKTQCTL